MWSWKTGHICRSYLMFELCADVPGSSELVLKMMSQIQWLIAILPQFPIEMATYWSSPMFRQFKNIWWRLHHPNCQCNHKKTGKPSRNDAWESCKEEPSDCRWIFTINPVIIVLMEVSIGFLSHGGTPKSSIFIGFCIIKTSLWGNHFRKLPNPEFCMVNELQGRCLCRCRALGWGAGRLRWGLATGRRTLDGTVIWLESICNIL